MAGTRRERKEVGQTYRTPRKFMVNLTDNTAEGAQVILWQPPRPVPEELARISDRIATIPYTPGMDIPTPGRTKSTYNKERDRCDECAACAAWKDSTGCAQHGWGLYWSHDDWMESYITLYCYSPDVVETFLKPEYDMRHNRCAQCDTCPIWRQDTGCPRYGIDIVSAVTGLPALPGEPEKCVLDLNNPDIREEFGLKAPECHRAHGPAQPTEQEEAADGEE